jgi:DNA-directed RNA polymerase specialized sigma24 family protein
MSDTTLIHRMYNCETGKTTDVPYTPEEIAAAQAVAPVVQAQQEAMQEAMAAREAASQSAAEKLAALGLTPEEIAAFTNAPLVAPTSDEATN